MLSPKYYALFQYNLREINRLYRKINQNHPKTKDKLNNAIRYGLLRIVSKKKQRSSSININYINMINVPETVAAYENF